MVFDCSIPSNSCQKEEQLRSANDKTVFSPLNKFRRFDEAHSCSATSRVGQWWHPAALHTFLIGQCSLYLHKTYLH